jgi:crotonobetainyl-CoA:carnitine CoA-transferase CaiB-like acyl-CoA transferase
MRSQHDQCEVFPLDGVLVVDLTAGIAGGYCSKVLADAGAEVVKVEAREGDFLRRWSASGSRPPDQDGALFQFLACSKRSVVIDPHDREDRELLDALIGTADAVIWSADGALGANSQYAPWRIAELAPTASVVTITPYGLDGPWAGLASAEATLQAMSGGPGMRGDKSRPPILAVAGWGTGWRGCSPRSRCSRRGTGAFAPEPARSSTSRRSRRWR